MPFAYRRRTAYGRRPVARRRYARRTVARKPAYRKRGTYRRRTMGAGRMFKRGGVTGHGAYKINRNSLLQGTAPPQFIKNGAGIKICHREYLGDLISGMSGPPSNFNLQNFILQPGLPASFPWLSNIAANFQEYELNGAIIYIKSLAADAIVANGTTNSIGSSIVATNYNPVAANYINKQEMLESEYATDAKISEDISHPIECARRQTPVSHLYIRTGAVPAGGTAQLFDFCNVQIATQGVAALNSTVGEIWISYECTLYKPLLQGGLAGNDLLADKWQLLACTGGTNPLGTTHTLVTGSNLGCTINTTGTTITFPTFVEFGNFLVMIRWIGTSAACTVPVFTSNGNTFLTVWCSGAAVDANNNANSTTTNSTPTFHACFLLNIPETNPNFPPYSIQVGVGGTLPTANCNADMVIMQVPAWTT